MLYEIGVTKNVPRTEGKNGMEDFVKVFTTSNTSSSMHKLAKFWSDELHIEFVIYGIYHRTVRLPHFPIECSVHFRSNSYTPLLC